MNHRSRFQPPIVLLILAMILLGVSTISAQTEPLVEIGSLHESTSGGVIEVPVRLNGLYGCCDPVAPMGHFSFLIQYDTTGLEFLSAAAGEAIANCGWEYFAWAAGSNVDCGGTPCSRDFIRIVAIADVANGDQHPSCLPYDTGTLANLSFRVTADSTGECQWFPIRFTWYDCNDNILAASPDADTVSISDYVEFVDMYPEPPLDSTFPTQTGAPTVCDTVNDSVTRLRGARFRHGGVALDCNFEIPDRGDINLNGLSNEIADLVMFANYLVLGDTAFGSHVQASYENTDINDDGDTATVDDLVYLARVIIGDAVPYPSPVKSGAANPAIVLQDLSARTVSVGYPDTLYGIYLVFDGEIAITPSINPDLMAWDTHDGQTNVLIFPLYLNDWAPVLIGGGELLSYTGDGLLRHAEVSFNGMLDVPVDIHIPGCCVLRGDVDYSGEVNIGDITLFVEYLFQGGWAPTCPAHGDVNGDSSTDVSDLTALVAYLFSGGDAPAPCPR